jgi:hypothetical protein
VRRHEARLHRPVELQRWRRQIALDRTRNAARNTYGHSETDSEARLS